MKENFVYSDDLLDFLRSISLLFEAGYYNLKDALHDNNCFVDTLHLGSFYLEDSYTIEYLDDEDHIVVALNDNFAFRSDLEGYFDVYRITDEELIF